VVGRGRPDFSASDGPTSITALSDPLAGVVLPGVKDVLKAARPDPYEVESDKRSD
jgi:hypothetical protein